MCTPQLRARAAALQGAANPDPIASSIASNAGDSPATRPDPLQRQALALAPFAKGAGANPVMTRNAGSSLATDSVTNNGAPDLLSDATLASLR
jgi:hypothetical protein